MAILSDNISQFWSKLGQSNEQNKLQFMALAKDIGLEISAEELPYISYPFIIEIYLNKKMKLYF